SNSADGVEDSVSHAAIPAKALAEIGERLALLIAIELMIGAQAAELRGVKIAPKLRPLIARIREICPPLGDQDRSLTAEIEALAAEISAGRLIP
ncbi:MAG: aromatic amino acid lyase, partial [Pseudomonadota bacterium]